MSRSIEEELQGRCGDGEWAARGGIHAAWREARPREDIDASIAQLARLYPAEIMRTRVGMPKSPLDQVVLPLLNEGWQPGSGELLQLGLDLAACDGWEDQRHLIARLRNEAEFGAARFEVGLWAGARRVGLEARYVKATQDQDCDIEFVDGGERIRVEAKVCRTSDRARGAAHVWDAVHRAVRVCTDHLPSVGGMELAIQLERPIVDLLSKGGPEFDERLEALSQALEAHLDFCVRPLALDATTSDVADVGRVRFRRGQNGNGVAIEIDDIGDEPLREAMRALRLAADARKQLVDGATTLRVAVVSTGSLDCPATYAAAIGAREVRSRPERFAGIDWIAFVNAHTKFGDWRPTVAPLAVAASATVPGEARWLKAMTAWQRSC